MEQFIHQISCPQCGFKRSWKLRRQGRKCKRCRKEWSPIQRIKGSRASCDEWRTIITAFLRDRTIMHVAEVANLERHTVQRMLRKIRMIMMKDVPEHFKGTTEMDETYIGGKWINKPAWIRRRGSKRGHGTSKQGIFGILNRDTKQVRTFLVSNLKTATIFPIIYNIVERGSRVCTDGYSIYKPMRHRYDHHIVDHAHGEYARGDVHTNSIESFWGFLKKRLSVTGGIRPKYFPLFVGEHVWRYNHRHLSREKQTERILKRLVED